MSDLTHYTLSNGLNVILREVHSAPVISWWLAYRIGSRNEPTGKTGISHWVEHMMFKGTPSYPPGTLDRTVDRSGGQWNAFTSSDYTMYYMTMPADRVSIPMEVEADRMFNTIFDPEEVESERTVIISERQGAENKPTFWLNEALKATAFRVHGYHHEILGDMAVLVTISRDDLYEHYQRYYRPSNATLVAVGAFDTAEMQEKIEAIYGGLPLLDKPTEWVRPEPPQIGERRVVVERPGNTSFVKYAYHVPNTMHDDWYKLDVLDSILTGASGISNKTSRLYKALVQTELAVNVSGGVYESIDPNLYTITITARQGRSHQEIETALDAEIERIKNEGISHEELERSRKRARASFAYATEGITEQAYWLAQSALLGDLHWFDRYLDRMQAVTVEDVQEAAQKYLIKQNRTVGWLVPTGMEID
ncbi:pitrilysin family protein [Anaerolineales bacterium]